jgi:hypothetical protein
MEHPAQTLPIERTGSVNFLEAVDRAMYEGVQRALAEHKRLGQSIVVERDGQIVEIPPEEIVVADEFLPPPLRQAL